MNSISCMNKIDLFIRVLKLPLVENNKGLVAYLVVCFMDRPLYSLGHAETNNSHSESNFSLLFIRKCLSSTTLPWCLNEHVTAK